MHEHLQVRQIRAHWADGERAGDVACDLHRHVSRDSEVKVWASAFKVSDSKVWEAAEGRAKAIYTVHSSRNTARAPFFAKLRRARKPRRYTGNTYIG